MLTWTEYSQFLAPFVTHMFLLLNTCSIFITCCDIRPWPGSHSLKIVPAHMPIIQNVSCLHVTYIYDAPPTCQSFWKWNWNTPLLVHQMKIIPLHSPCHLNHTPLIHIYLLRRVNHTCHSPRPHLIGPALISKLPVLSIIPVNHLEHTSLAPPTHLNCSALSFTPVNHPAVTSFGPINTSLAPPTHFIALPLSAPFLKAVHTHWRSTRRSQSFTVADRPAVRQSIPAWQDESQQPREGDIQDR